MASLARIVLSLALPALLVGCTGATEGDETPVTPGTPEAKGPFLAEVGGIRITAEEFEAAASRKVPADGVALSAQERQDILDELVVEKMLYLEAKKRGIDQDPKVQKVMVNTLLRQDVYAQVRNSDFTTEQLMAYYEAHQDEFVVPEKVQIKRIFIKAEPKRTPAEAEALARRLYTQVMADPASFRDLAVEHSDDPFKRRGGDLGYIEAEGKPGIEPAVVEKGFSLDIGQVAEPFEAGGGWNVVMVTGRRERLDRSFETMRGSVLRKVKADRYKELYAEYVAQLRADYPIRVDEGVLSSVEVKPARRMTLAPTGDEPATLEDDEDLLEGMPE